jgi:hypothetical protein
MAYQAGHGAAEFVVLDGVEQPAHSRIGNMAFSPDGKHFAYLANDNDKACVIIDGKQGPDYEDTNDAWPVSFSPDSKRIACVALKGGKVRVIVDGAASDAFDDVYGGGPVFRPDGTLEGLVEKNRVIYRLTSAAP